ncbi:MAG TPA: hypothetical protein VIM41_01855 [Gammaproteobacteria bacterium]
MENIQKLRLIAGAIASPFIVPLAIYLTMAFVFGSDLHQNQEIQTSISTASWVAYGIALVFSTGGYFWLQKKRWESVVYYIAGGTVVGFASWLLFSLISQTLVSLLFFVFIIAGALLGGSFWLIAFFQPNGQYPQPSRRRRRR